MKNYINDLKSAITASSVNWSEFEGKKIFVTGATGMIGRAVVDMLYMAGEIYNIGISIYVLVRDLKKARELYKEKNVYDNCADINTRKDASANISITLIQGDVCQKQSYPATDYIIHAASYGDPAAFVKDPVSVIKANLEGTMNMLEYAKENNSRILFVSTGEVYGYTGKAEPYIEEEIGRLDFNKSRSCYPESKRAAENMCVCYSEQYGVDVVRCRPCHTYGQTMTEKDSRVAAQFIRNAVDGENIVMKSAGNQKRSMCYVVDTANAIITILQKGERSQVYNIGNHASEVTIRQMARILTKTAGTKLVIQIPEEEEKKGYSVSEYQILSDEKLIRLGWKPLTKVEDGLEKVVQDLKSMKI
ncbi:NAD-dependent epimerase/dehydratase family protein [Eubacterium sp. MSJ-13]|uniref:NAD-dependent epimerase/dehydratase family protein n=1 Tax=Eubacterium sp. MSJ-13 TaxID=2841513 RepID=UPI001C1158F5|nr:NAD-dependent epimerase/dehydratase family protein [Eubacterium sp. MSJ-13]MBU5477597.1 NAD-dependent epimerase/dehydratase family protein [Eubacterium sp. MSJ-13]